LQWFVIFFILISERVNIIIKQVRLKKTVSYSLSILNLYEHQRMLNSVQTYLQSITVRLEEWRLKRRDTEEWMSHRQLPQNLRERVRRFVQYKWLATRGVDEETILRGLPIDLRRDIQRHLCLDLVRRVSFLSACRNVQ